MARKAPAPKRPHTEDDCDENCRSCGDCYIRTGRERCSKCCPCCAAEDEE